ncbi:hypothetical protein [Paenibacillus lentus]|uniref:hypothetical protein n=1 Tax=Paenibacillus lentus TaxID=1338368 RepID=UPI0026D1A70C
MPRMTNFIGKGMMYTLAKHSGESWKKDHPSTLFGYSVQKADRAVKQAMSHPEETTVGHASNSISHAENALLNAEQHNEHMDIVEQNREQLEVVKEQLQEVQEIVED